MIDFATVAPAIKDAVTALGYAGVSVPTGATAPEATWSRRPKGFTPPVPQLDLTLSITSIGQIGGRDETRYTYDSGTNSYIPRQYGQRQLNVQIKVESFNDTDSLWCWGVAENIRTGLDTASVRDTLMAACVAVVNVSGDIVRFEISRDNRTISACIVSAVFVAPLSDSNEVAINHIETIDLTSHVTNASGVEVAGNFQDEVMP